MNNDLINKICNDGIEIKRLMDVNDELKNEMNILRKNETDLINKNYGLHLNKQQLLDQLNILYEYISEYDIKNIKLIKSINLYHNINDILLNIIYECNKHDINMLCKYNIMSNKYNELNVLYNQLERHCDRMEHIIECINMEHNTTKIKRKSVYIKMIKISIIFMLFSLVILIYY